MHELHLLIKVSGSPTRFEVITLLNGDVDIGYEHSETWLGEMKTSFTRAWYFSHFADSSWFICVKREHSLQFLHK